MSADKVYQLKVVLRHITPLIWRRLLVTSDTTIAQLHYIGYFPTKEPKVPHRFAEMQFYEPFKSIYHLPKFRASEGSKIGKSKIG